MEESAPSTPKTETRPDHLSFIKKFILFVRQQGVIGLAVAFVIGGAIQKVVAAFVTDILNPIVSIFLGQNSDFTKASFTVGRATFLYGDFLSNVMNFLIIVLAIYLLVNGIHADMLDKPKDEA